MITLSDGVGVCLALRRRAVGRKREAAFGIDAQTDGVLAPVAVDGKYLAEHGAVGQPHDVVVATSAKRAVHYLSAGELLELDALTDKKPNVGVGSNPSWMIPA